MKPASLHRSISIQSLGVQKYRFDLCAIKNFQFDSILRYDPIICYSPVLNVFPINIAGFYWLGTKVGFFKVVTPPPRWRAEFYLRVGILIWLSRLCFSANLVKPKLYGLPKLCFLSRSESKWGLSRTNTTPRDKRGVTTSKNLTLNRRFSILSFRSRFDLWVTDQ
eukprot:sb/3472566/